MAREDELLEGLLHRVSPYGVLRLLQRKLEQWHAADQKVRTKDKSWAEAARRVGVVAEYLKGL